ncbi:hypothetical protein AAFF_G00432290, partial [Aldrovandia affinis]
DFLKYSCQLTLDLNTVHKWLRLFEGKREIKRLTWLVQSYPAHPERFDGWEQVLCREGLSGRCYWEVEWNGGFIIAVSYKEISRKGGGHDCGLGYNDKSWSLHCTRSSLCFRHNNKKTEIAAHPSSKIGVYLEHREGTLSFYSISIPYNIMT